VLGPGPVVEVDRARPSSTKGGGTDGLEAALDTAALLDRGDLVAMVAVHLSRVYGDLWRPADAERMLRRVLNEGGPGAHEQLDLRSELAAALSEQGRLRQALPIQQAVIAGFQASGREPPASDWVRLGNYRRETGDLEGACEAFEGAAAVLGPSAPDSVPVGRAQALALLGQARVQAGDPDGLDQVEEALRLVSSAVPMLTVLHLYAIATTLYLQAGRLDDARAQVRHARGVQRQYLAQTPSFEVWQGLLGGWTEFDFHEVELALAHGGDGATRALLAAEAAKGRLLGWAATGFSAEVAASVLDDDQAERDLAEARSWLRARPGRSTVLSLVATRRGIAVFTLRQDGVDGAWACGPALSRARGGRPRPVGADAQSCGRRGPAPLAPRQHRHRVPAASDGRPVVARRPRGAARR
jgi:tetratricopeptide (TPR) repeat protein